MALEKKSENAEAHRFSKNGLYMDYLCVLQPLMIAFLGEFEKIEPIETYTEYFQSRKNPKIIGASNPKSMEVLNAKVEKFNSDLPKIIGKKDAEAVKNFIEEAKEFFK